jgi:hypothetical protein
MRCDEVQEGFIDLLYEDSGAPHASSELREHLRTCPNCRKELEELSKTRKFLQLWKDEPPLADTVTARREPPDHRVPGWRPLLRYAAIAAMVLITFLALANTQITWNKDGFSFRAQMFAKREPVRDYYTKAEFRSMVKQALDDSESRMNETNYLMMQKMLDTVEQDRWMDLRLIRNNVSKNLSKN